MNRKQSKIALATVVILFIVAGLMSFLGGSEAVSVFSRYNSNQDQTTQQDNQTFSHNQQNGTTENSGGNNQGAENSQNTEAQQQESANGQQDQTAKSQENQQSDYRIDVDVTEQIVQIYYQGSEIKQFTASTGANNLTPLGDFEIQNRGEWFFSEKYQQGAKYWVSFKDWGVYLFHSVPMDKQKKMIAEEAAKLGTPASHGCIRLEVENAKWIYNNIPQGTKVHIH
ncbi:L,D-transpeptidase [Dehalobacter sp. TeCB1]|uniref:L,D-transpeptidase n=1 Tax=Dehalobacter sp. TeCB1 TaxID=1843715 RepID=UPI00083A93B5|nr:L,D-transpeptidase [Dehalobacter sp. TeCB1]OCZ53753.1 hypothetical protein A7D23_07265 [Dehalobacter sp. TeCB1]